MPLTTKCRLLLLSLVALIPPSLGAAPAPVTWTADNGNGPFTNTVFFD